MTKNTQNLYTTTYQDVEFQVAADGIYKISVTAACKQKEDLRIEIDGHYFREVPAADNVQKFNIPASWNGEKLRGLAQTNFYIICLNKGEHVVRFIYKTLNVYSVDISSKKIVQHVNPEQLMNKNDGETIYWDYKLCTADYKTLNNLDTKISFPLDIESCKRNEQPWINIIIDDLPVQKIETKASVSIHDGQKDHDDIQIKIDGRPRQNDDSKKMKNWLWHAQKSDILPLSKKSIEVNLSRGYHIIEYIADQTPKIHDIDLYLNYQFGEISASSKELKRLDKKIGKGYPEAHRLEMYTEYYGNDDKPTIIVYTGGLLPLASEHSLFYWNEKNNNWESVKLFDVKHKSEGIFNRDNGVNIEKPQPESHNPLPEGWLAFNIGTTWLIKHFGPNYKKANGWKNDLHWALYKNNK